MSLSRQSIALVLTSDPFIINAITCLSLYNHVIRNIDVYCVVCCAQLHCPMVSLLTGAVYLKNMVLHHWASSGDSAVAEFVIHDSDKNVIRDNVVEAVIVSESLIRSMFVTKL